jgi:hypothetical protein
MKSTSPLPLSGELLRVPFRLAERLTIDGLTAAQTRLAIVLGILAAEDGSWTIAKPILERMTGIVMNNARKILQPLENAMFVEPATDTRPARHIRMFDALEYAPGQRRETAGMITAKLTSSARHALESQGRIVTVPADEFRRYSSLGGIMLRLRLAAQLASTKGAKSAMWKLTADDMATAFGHHADKWVIGRKSVGGDDKSYVSLARAADLFFQPGIDEIAEVSETIHAELSALTLSDDARSRWKAIIIQSRPLHRARRKTDPLPAAPAKPSMSDLNNTRRARLPAYTRKQASIKSEAI